MVLEGGKGERVVRAVRAASSAIWLTVIGGIALTACPHDLGQGPLADAAADRILPPLDYRQPQNEGIPFREASADVAREASPVDVAQDLPPRDAIVADDVKRDTAVVQGTSCTAAGIELSAASPLKSCTDVDVTVVAKEAFVWVMVSIGTGSPTQWFGGAITTTCNDYCWRFPDVAVPCQPGPYSLHFMKDAENDNPQVGTVIASCTP